MNRKVTCYYKILSYYSDPQQGTCYENIVCNISMIDIEADVTTRYHIPVIYINANVITCCHISVINIRYMFLYSSNVQKEHIITYMMSH